MNAKVISLLTLRVVGKQFDDKDYSFNGKFVFQFSYGVGWLLFDDKLFRLGLFVLGSCPGGTGSNFWCILLNGDLNLSITMTFISTVAALGKKDQGSTVSFTDLGKLNLVAVRIL